MNPIEKTNSVGRKFLPISVLVPNENNPNVMEDREFNILATNIERTGITDPILVRPLENEKYRIVGGHHRFEVAKVLGFEEVPCTIITDPEFDDDQETFQVVAMNTIRGKISPEKFLKMYQSLSPKYTDEILKESFGFADEDEFRKLIKSVGDSLPNELKKDFTKAAKELKTIEGLSVLLNTLFTTHGKSIQFQYMVFDYDGKESMWLRVSKKTFKSLLTIGDLCKKENRTMDAIIGGLINEIAEGKHSETLLQLIAKSPEVEIPDNVKIPTEEGLSGGLNVEL